MGVDPDFAVQKDLFLPDRHGLLGGIDDKLTGGNRLGAVGDELRIIMTEVYASYLVCLPSADGRDDSDLVMMVQHLVRFRVFAVDGNQQRFDSG